MKEDHGLALGVLVFLLVISMTITISICKNRDLYTPKEYISAIWERDSIEITKDNPKYAKKYLESLLDKQVKNYKVINAEYDDSIQAYKVLYRFNLIKDAENDSYPHMKTVWIKMNFNSNNGNYQIKPQLVKLVSWKDKKE